MKVVHLRGYKGERLSYNADGSYQNENQSIKIKYGVVEWKNYMNLIGKSGFCKVIVEKVYDTKTRDFDKDLTNYKEEVAKAFEQEVKKELTPEQKKIAELEAKIEALSLGKSDTSSKPSGEEKKKSTAPETIARLKECKTVEELEAMLEGEDRKGVLTAAEEIKKDLNDE